MKKEPDESVVCPKAKNGKCFNGGDCSHARPHIKYMAATTCLASDVITSRSCPACEPVKPAKPKNVVALLKSIAHWDRIAHGLEVSRGGENCECCKQFIDTECCGCLIKVAGFYGCEGTPFEEVAIYTVTKNQTPEALDAIEAEVEFLIACLPEAEQKAFNLENVQPFLRFGDKVWIGEEVVFFMDYPTPQRCRIFHFDPEPRDTCGYVENVSFSKLSLSPPKPKPKPQLWETLQVGQPLVVWDYPLETPRVWFFRRYVPGHQEPVKTSSMLDLKIETCAFQNFRLLTRAEAKKLGFDLNRWQWADDKTQEGE